jgi:hypothetical protein
MNAHRSSGLSACVIVFGIVMTASSYAMKPIVDARTSSVWLAIGLLMLLAPAVLSVFSAGFHWRSVAVYLSLVGTIELLNLMNLANPLDFRMMMHRYICYAICAAGIVYGYESMDDFRQFSGIAHVITAGFSCLVAGIWLRSASAAVAGVRFVGDSEMLTPVGVGYTFGIMACVSAAFMLTEQRLIFRAMHFVAYCACVMAILSTGSRGSAVFSLVIVAAGIAIRLRSFEDGLRYSLLFLALLIVLSAVVMTNSYARSQMDFMLTRFEFISRGTVDLSILERTETQLFYYKSIDSWILTGMRGYEFNYPHNIFFECLLRYGVVGFGLIGAILFGAYRAFRNLRISFSSPVVWVISSVGFFTLLIVQVNLMLEHARWLWLFVGYWGVKEAQQLRFGRLEHSYNDADDDEEEMAPHYGELRAGRSLENA